MTSPFIADSLRDVETGHGHEAHQHPGDQDDPGQGVQHGHEEDHADEQRADADAARPHGGGSGGLALYGAAGIWTRTLFATRRR
ncbi:hypothetical protein [Nonomuraea sp. NPDC049400]|uniref:hypothetical protein n=1 Tax=Nonomuraea sp. NPDC049400 TaxID=3364352 RepID=UPI00379DC78E